MARTRDPFAHRNDQNEHSQEVVVTNDKKQPGLPVVEVDQAFPLLTTDGTTRLAGGTATANNQGPAVSAAIRDVLGWRPRRQDPKAFTAALAATFELSTVEDHVVARYVPRGVAVQADLGGVTGGQASLYLRAKASHEQITRMLDSLKPLRADADPEDCEAYRGLVRDSVRRIVMELGREGGPRVPLVDSAFGVLTGFQPGLAGPSANPLTIQAVAIRKTVRPATAETDADTIPGQLGALRDRFGLDDDHVNNVDEEKHRTSFLTLVDLIVDIQRSWENRRDEFTLSAGNGFLGTDLVQISRLLAAAAEQVDELEAVLDSVLVSPAERQTIVLDLKTGLTLDDLVQWMRVFFTEDGPNIIRDTGRDGLVSSFTPTAVDLLLTLRNQLVRRVIPCCGSSCANGCVCGLKNRATFIPLGCCTPLPPGMYAGRVKIAVSSLCGLVERLAGRAIRIGRFAGVVLLDLTVTPFHPEGEPFVGKFVRVEVRGLHVRPTYVPAFVADDTAHDPTGLVLPLQGSASADQDGMSAIFDLATLPLPQDVRTLLIDGDGVLLAASEVPMAVVDGELGRVVQGPGVTTWPKLRQANDINIDGAIDTWRTIPPNQRFVPQSPPDPLAPQVANDFLERCEDDCLEDCGDDCMGCDCGCHSGAQYVLRDAAGRAPVEIAATDLATSAKVAARNAATEKVTAERAAADLASAERTAVKKFDVALADAKKADADMIAAREKAEAKAAKVKRAADKADAKKAGAGKKAAKKAAANVKRAIRAKRKADKVAMEKNALAKAATDRAAVAKATADWASAARAAADQAVVAKANANKAAAAKAVAAKDAIGSAVAARVAADLAAAEQAAAEKAEVDLATADQAEPTGGQGPPIDARSESELLALDGLRGLIAEQSGTLESRVKQIQDSRQIRRFVVAALRAAEAARAAGDTRADDKEQ
jgi:hypothetical protein